MQRPFGIALTIATLFVIAADLSAATVQACGQGCVCITWTFSTGAYIEVRCPDDGLAPAGEPTDTSSWGGTSTNYLPLGPAPGTPLDAETGAKVQSAETDAYDKLRRERLADGPAGSTLPNDCADLFLEAPWSERGAWLVSSYIIYRNGTGVIGNDGTTPCASGVPAWTTCCRHEPYVFICPSAFNGLSATDRALTLIHEALHVAGQREDKNSTFGPSDPPSSGQINAAVRAACDQ
ncbi:MAG TPA: hypothetical protein VF698_06745 [Thermoanaerobaculia bacterium]|jgi:hypothetical protein